VVAAPRTQARARAACVTARVEAPDNVGLARVVNGRVELAACNLYFALPLSVQATKP
jgi:hypothetical protein